MVKTKLVRTIALVIFFLFCLPSLAPAQILKGHQQAVYPIAFTTTKSLAFIEQGPTLKSTLYADGRAIDLQTESVTWPILQNETIDLTQNQFKTMVNAAKITFESDPNKIIISKGNSRGLDIQFSVTSPPPGAQAAINAVATYIESLFTDPVTVVITLGFKSMSPGILGSTTCNYASSVTWTNTRAGLIASMDPDDIIQSYLPSGSTIPVRYNGNSPTVTNENRCFFTIANYRATIGSVSGNAADMSINKDFSWDYDPSNGITPGSYCFQSVLAHEVGHVLGFTSGADFRHIIQDIETLDVYRFQRSDGAGNYNPDTYAEFQTTARMVDQNAPGTNDDVNSDIISEEYRMSDGDPYQCSHFSQGNVYAIMQPAFSSGSTFYPDFYKTPDKTMLDAIGWDYVVPPDVTPPATTHSFSGTMGNNGWYVSTIIISLYALDNESGVDHTYYRIDGGSWMEYATPISFTLEGIHTLSYYSVDKAGNAESPKGPFSLKIDLSIPTITLTKQELDPFTIKITAEVSDTTSGIDRVEFILDGSVVYTATQAPYEWTWSGIGSHSLIVTVYDKAGNSQSQSISNPVIQGMNTGVPRMTEQSTRPNLHV